MNTIDKILIACAVAIIVFTVTMVVIFCVFQAIPDSLVECFYSLFTGEIVITFFIWWIKKKATNKKETKDNGKTEKP